MVDITQKTFAARLNWLCDQHPEIPELNNGRQVTLKGVFKVSQEAVRKWLSGESEPRKPKMMEMVAYFGCRWEWLYSGDGEPFPSTEGVSGQRAPYGPPSPEQLMELLSEDDKDELLWRISLEKAQHNK